MKKAVLSLLVFIGLMLVYFEMIAQTPKTIVEKFSFGKRGKNLGEFERPFGLDIRGEYLFTADSGNNRIQVLKINQDGTFLAKSVFTFMKGDKKLEPFLEFFGPIDIAIKGNYLYVADTRNLFINLLKIDAHKNLSSYFIYTPTNKRDELFIIGSLDIKGNYLFATDPENDRIQVLEIKY
jgi:6-phosphogluconolactonase (cycloisomerase 2 family)